MVFIISFNQNAVFYNERVIRMRRPIHQDGFFIIAWQGIFRIVKVYQGFSEFIYLFFSNNEDK